MKRSLAVGLVVAAVVAGGGVGWAITRIDHHSPRHSSTPPATKPTKTPVRVIDYVTHARPIGLSIARADQVDELTGAGADFKQFVAGTVGKVLNPRLCKAKTSFNVFTYATNGFAVGAVSDCGGYQALWGIKDGVWKQLIGTQGGWICSDLHKLGAPKGILGNEQCADLKTNKLIDYRG